MNSFFPNNYRPSFWDYDAIFPRDLDFCIVGAGYTGMGMAMGVRRKFPDARITIFEQFPFGAAASSKNAGFLCFGSPSEILDTIHNIGEDDTFSLIEKRWVGAQFLKNICESLHVPIENHGGYEVFMTSEEMEAVMDTLPQLNSMLSKISPELQWTRQSVPWARQGKVLFSPAEGQLHPGRLLQALKQHLEKLNIRIIYNCRLTDYHQKSPIGVSLTANKSFHFQTRNLLLATNAFQNDLDDVLSARNIVLLYEMQGKSDIRANIHYDKGYVYMREVDGRFLIGGGRNIDVEKEATTQFGMNPTVTEYLHKCLRDLVNFPVHRTPFSHWSGIITSSENGVPLFRKLDKNIYYAGRYGGMGVALALSHGHKIGLSLKME